MLRGSRLHKPAGEIATLAVQISHDTSKIRDLLHKKAAKPLCRFVNKSTQMLNLILNLQLAQQQIVQPTSFDKRYRDESCRD
jgi:hypothetical protein